MEATAESIACGGGASTVCTAHVGEVGDGLTTE